MLMRAKEQAEQPAEMKTSSLNSMSHEIRTPLTGILWISEALASAGNLATEPGITGGRSDRQSSS